MHFQLKVEPSRAEEITGFMDVFHELVSVLPDEGRDKQAFPLNHQSLPTDPLVTPGYRRRHPKPRQAAAPCRRPFQAL
jgi:hypothetical protein